MFLCFSALLIDNTICGKKSFFSTYYWCIENISSDDTGMCSFVAANFSSHDRVEREPSSLSYYFFISPIIISGSVYLQRAQ